MKRKFSFPYSALKYQLVFFQSEENHIDNICNITTYEIKILILHYCESVAFLSFQSVVQTEYASLELEIRRNEDRQACII